MVDTFGWRVTFALVSVLTVVLTASMAVSLPRNSHPARVGLLGQFRLFFDHRIQLSVTDMVSGAAVFYVSYMHLSPIIRDEIGVSERYTGIDLVIYGCACLWSNLYGGELVDKGYDVESLTHVRPIYYVQVARLCLLALASLPTVGATTLPCPCVEHWQYWPSPIGQDRSAAATSFAANRTSWYR